MIKYISAAIGISVGALLSMWTLDRDNPVAYLSAYAMETSVQAGTALVVEFTVSRSDSCVTNVQRKILDSNGRVWNLSESIISSPVNIGIETYRREYYIPNSMPKGKSTFYLQVSYVCNPVHNFWPVVKDHAIEVPFTVK